MTPYLAVAVGNIEKLPPKVKKRAQTQMKNIASPPSGVAIKVNMSTANVAHNVNIAAWEDMKTTYNISWELCNNIQIFTAHEGNC